MTGTDYFRGNAYIADAIREEITFSGFLSIWTRSRKSSITAGSATGRKSELILKMHGFMEEVRPGF